MNPQWSRASSTVRLGLRENLPQFGLLVVVNAFVGAMVGLERSIIPAMAEQEFQLVARTAVLSFIVVFGVAKALTNYGAGRLSDRHGRKHVLVGGWLVAAPVPFLFMWAPSWNWVLATGWMAARYGIRPQTFSLGVGFVIVGLARSVLVVRETRHHHVSHESALLASLPPDGMPTPGRCSGGRPGWMRTCRASFRPGLSTTSTTGAPGRTHGRRHRTPCSDVAGRGTDLASGTVCAFRMAETLPPPAPRPSAAFPNGGVEAGDSAPRPPRQLAVETRRPE